MSITAYEVITATSPEELTRLVDEKLYNPEQPLADGWQPWGPMYTHMTHRVMIAGAECPIYRFCQTMVKIRNDGYPVETPGGNFQSQGTITGRYEASVPAFEEKFEDGHVLNMSNEDLSKQSPVIVAACNSAADYARAKYAEPSNNDIEINNAPNFAKTEEGVWVSGWLWVAWEDI